MEVKVREKTRRVVKDSRGRMGYLYFIPWSFDYDKIIITKSDDNYSDCVANINDNSMIENVE